MDAPGRGRGRGGGRGGGRGAGGRGPVGPYPHTEVTVLLETLEFPVQIYDHIKTVEGIRYMDDFRLVAQSEIDRIATRMDLVGIAYTAPQISMIKALFHLVKRNAQMNVVVPAHTITRNLLIQELDLMSDSNTSTASTNQAKAQLPDKFKHDTRWRSFRDALNNYLDRTRGRRNVPLTYITRPVQIPADANPTDAIWTTEHTGPLFNEDNKLVYNLIESLCLEGPAETYIRRFKSTRNGRGAYLLLNEHFDGGSYQTVKINQAWRTLRETKYDGRKSNLDFATFRRVYDDAFRDLEEGGQGLKEPSMVTHLLAGIQGDTCQALQNLKDTVLSCPVKCIDYNETCLFFARSIAGNVNLDKISKARQVAVFHSTSDTTKRHFTDDEWNSLSYDEKQEIRRQRQEQHGGGRNQNGSGRNQGGRFQGRGHSGRFNSGGRGNGGRTQGARNPMGGRGGRFHGRNSQGRGRGGRNIAAVDANETDDYYYNDNEGHDYNYDDADEQDYGDANDQDIPIDDYPSSGHARTARVKKARFCNAIECVDRSISDINTVNSNGYYSRCELDSHADNAVVGRDAYILEEFPDQTYKVFGYRREDGYVERSIVKAAFAVDLADETIILVINQCFFDANLQNSLLNPNQIRACGHTVYDVPRQFDPQSPFCMTLEDNVKIPFSTKGCIVYFNARKPSDNELADCRHIELTASTWDPRNIDGIYRSSSEMNVDDLAKRLLIPKKVMEDTIKVTTRYASRVYDDEQPKYGRYGHRFRWLSRRRLAGTFFTDTFLCLESDDKNTAVQVFINEQRYVYAVPIKSRSEAPQALRRFLDDVGLPEEIANDNSKEQTSKEWDSILREFGIKKRNTEAYGPRRNYAENGVKLLKFRSAKIMQYKHVHLPFWDHCLIYAASLLNKTVHQTHRLDGRTPFEFIHGFTPDISPFIDFGFFDVVWYIVNTPGKFPSPKRKLGRWLGPSKQITSDLVYKILTEKGLVFHTSAVSPLTDEDHTIFKEQIESFNTSIRSKFGPNVDDSAPYALFGIKVSDYDDEEAAAISAVKVAAAESAVNTCEKAWDRDAVTTPAFNQRRVAPVMPKPVGSGQSLQNLRMPKPVPDKPTGGALVTPNKYREDLKPRHVMNTTDGGATTPVKNGTSGGASPHTHGWESARVRLNAGPGTVMRKKRNFDGDQIGSHHSNPLLDSTIYEVDLDNGGTIEVASHTIAESIFDSTTDGFDFIQLDHIIEHHCFFSDYTFLVRWKDESEDVVDLKTLKSSYPIELSKYAQDNGLLDEEPFKWCKHVLKKQRHFLKVKARVHKRFKFGIQVPRNVDEAIALDSASGTKYWAQAIEKEMNNVSVAFDFSCEKPPPGYKRITYHIIFDVKANGDRKARLVAGGHLVDAGDILTYSSVVSRDSIRVLLTIAALNGLDILSTDIQGAYLYAQCKEKVYFYAGKEFLENSGKLVVIVRALYGLKSSGSAFRSKLAADLRELGYRSSLADADVWMKNRGDYYEFLLVYVDDVLLLSKDPNEFMTQFKSLYKLKAGFNKPQTFLGADISYFDVQDESGKTTQVFGISSKDYITRAIKNFTPQLHGYGISIPSTAVAPIRTEYHPEIDDSETLDSDCLTLYQSIIGTLRWLVELGRIDIAHSVAVMSAFLSCPRWGHLVEAAHILGYLKNFDDYALMFDPMYPTVDTPTPSFDPVEWKEFYPDAEEPNPPNAPVPKGHPVTIHCYVDADHAGDLKTRRSHSGILLYVNSAPVVWVSKKQKTIETSTHGAELVATRMAMELVESLMYKLKMFGVPIDGSTIVFCDNASVVHNGSKPESTLKKKHNSISFHRIRECVAAGFITIVKIGSAHNRADILTKSLTGVVTEFLSKAILYKLE